MAGLESCPLKLTIRHSR